MGKKIKAEEVVLEDLVKRIVALEEKQQESEEIIDNLQSEVNRLEWDKLDSFDYESNESAIEGLESRVCDLEANL